MTGAMHFNDVGQRDVFYLEVLELSESDGFKKIATWDPTQGINMTRSLSDVYTQISHSLTSKTLVVVSRLGMPYLQMK